MTSQCLRGHVIPLGIPNRNQQKTLLVFLLFILAFPSSTNRVLAIWFGLVWCGLIKREGQDSLYFIFLRATMASSELNGRVWLFRNKKLFVGNLSLFVNKMLACVGSIFQALYMALRVSLYLSSSIWGMPRDLSYDHFCVFCWPMCCLCVTPKGIYSDGFLFVCGHHHLGLLFLACAFEEGGHSTFKKRCFPRQQFPLCF